MPKPEPKAEREITHQEEPVLTSPRDALTAATGEISANLESRMAQCFVLRYGLAGASNGIALGLALLSYHYDFHNVEVPLFLLAVAISAWYAGPGSPPFSASSIVTEHRSGPRASLTRVRRSTIRREP